MVLPSCRRQLSAGVEEEISVIYRKYKEKGLSYLLVRDSFSLRYFRFWRRLDLEMVVKLHRGRKKSWTVVLPSSPQLSSGVLSTLEVAESVDYRE